MNKIKSKSLNRNSSFELLRIIAMLTIISHHYFVHGIGQILDISPPHWRVNLHYGLSMK